MNRITGAAVSLLALTSAFAGAMAPASAAGPTPVCSVAQLRVGYAPRISPVTGEHATPLKLVNSSRTACYLRGFPTVRLYDSSGRMLPFGYDRMAYQLHLEAYRVVLKPGAAAESIIDQYRCDSGVSRDAATVALVPPGDRQALTFRFNASLSPSYCTPFPGYSTIAGNTIDLWPIRRFG